MAAEVKGERALLSECCSRLTPAENWRNLNFVLPVRVDTASKLTPATKGWLGFYCGIKRRCELLADAATPPLPAAAAATATTATATSPAATAAPATAAATPGNFVTKLRLSALFVEDIEGRQADVGKFFLAEDDFVVRGGLLRGQVRQLSPARRGRGATRQRQQTGST